MVVKHASQAEHECALNRRCCHEGGVRSCGGSERERFEDWEDCARGVRRRTEVARETKGILTVSSSQAKTWSSSAFRLREDAREEPLEVSGTEEAPVRVERTSESRGHDGETGRERREREDSCDAGEERLCG